MKVLRLVCLGAVLAAIPARAWAADDEDEPEFEGEAEVKAPPREPTQHTLDEAQLTTIPGTRGDALRAIEIMPGVSRTQFATNGGPPLLRGSASGESLVLFDGAPAPLIYHFGGLTSVFNSHLLESVTLYPGNFSTRFGRASGGAIEARIRDPKSDRLHAMLELSAVDSFALTEGPIGSKSSLAMAARRSNIDLFFKALLNDDSTAVVAAPVYWDYQVIFAHRFDSVNKLRLLAYGSSDAFELHLGKAANDDPALQGQLDSRISFHHVQLELESRFSDRVTQQLMLSVGPSPGHGRLGTTDYDYTSWDANARAAWGLVAAPWLRFDAGLDAQALSVKFRYHGPAPAPEEGVPSWGALASGSQVSVDSRLRAVRPAGYVEASIRPVRQLLFVPGVRVDYLSDQKAWTVDPRLSSRLELFEGTALKAGVGQYSQPAEYWQAMKGFGNAAIKPYRTQQTSVGVEQAIGKVASIDLDGFYKHWQNRVLGTPGGAPPSYVNGGTGDAYGVELLFDARVTEKTRAYASYTLSRSTRRDGASQPTRLFDRDQTHNLTLGGNYAFGHGFLVGARFRYVTGSPYSAVEGAAYDASSDTYRPLYGAINGARLPAFHQLDLRAEKLWRFGPVDLTAYLEVMNVYNAKNQEGQRYAFDYQQAAGVNGLPLFPNVGIRGEL